MLALNDAKILPETEIIGILSDAAQTHENAFGPECDRDMHIAAALLINRIISGGNSMRRGALRPPAASL